MKEIFWRGVRFLGLAAAIAVSGCGSQEPSADTTSAEEAEVAEYLRATGTFDFEFDRAEGIVILEGDIIVPFSELLGQSRSFDPGELVDKGRWFAAPSHGVFSHRVTLWPIALAFDANVPGPWRQIVIAAATQWNAAECITYADSSPYTTTVHFRDLGPSKYHLYAQAPYPTATKTGIRAGGYLDINSTFDCPSNCGHINTLSTPLKMEIALHELGHTLGFAHQGELFLITGTSSSAPSVMAANLNEPGLLELTADDKLSRDKAYTKALRSSCSVDTFQ